MQKIGGVIEDATAKVITPKKNMPAIFKAPQLPAKAIANKTQYL